MSTIIDKLTPAANAMLARPQLVKGIQATAIVGLGTISGIAACLYQWVIPIVSQAPTTRAKTQQFKTIITLGLRYLQPSGRILAGVMACMAFVCSRSTNPVVYNQWKMYVAAMAIMVPTGPYETTMIFPTNDLVIGMGEQLKKEGKDDFGDHRDGQVDELLNSWRNWHVGRIVAPFAALTVLTWGAVDLLPL